MTPEDRELLQALRRQQMDLQRSLARIDYQLNELEARATASPAEPPPLPEAPSLPPLPEHHHLPGIPEDHHEASLPPLPATVESVDAAPPLPPLPPLHTSEPTAPAPSFEFQFGRWLIGLGAVFGVITLALVFSLAHHAIYKALGSAGILGLSALASLGVAIVGQRFERRGESLRILGNAIFAMALAWLYLTAYAACYYEPLQIITSPVIAGMLLLSWSIYVLLLAERKQSQALSLFAILLAYVSTAINPVTRFTMTADLLLAGTAVLFMVRNGWTALSYFSLAGTYLALLRRLILDNNGELTLDTSRMLHFWPHAVYALGAWLIFTAAVLFTTAPTFRGGLRFAFLSLNNGAMAGLLLLTTYIAGYGHGPQGEVLLATGLLLLITSRVIGWAQVEPEKIMAAYAAQGLALFTGGIMVLFTGTTRGLLLLLETLFLGMAGAFASDRILIITTYVVAFFATMFLTWEMSFNGHHPWIFGLSGALVMLLNGWWSRSELRHSPKSKSTFVLSTAYYCGLALGLVFTALATELSDNALPPALALAAMGFTFLIYFVALYELPPLAQIYLITAQALVLFPAETGEEMPWWTTATVAAITLLMLTWWTRQRITRSGSWIFILNFIYALALACLTYQTVRPWVDAQNWMMCAAILSVAFLVWGALTRVWPIAAVGQLFLAIAVYHFFIPPGSDAVYPWTWWAAALPILIVFSTARAAHGWLDLFQDIPAEWRTTLRALAYGYQVLTLLMVIRWVVAFVAPLDQIAVFLFLGTFLLSWNVRYPSAFGVRCSYVLSLTGVALYTSALPQNALALSTCFNALAFICFLAQAPLLHLKGKNLTSGEIWTLTLVSVAAGLLFVSFTVQSRFNPSYLTMGWAFYAFFLYTFGLLVREKRLCTCGSAILILAIIRVFAVDFWGFSSGYKILTFLVLAIIALSFGYLTLKTSTKAKKTDA